MLLIAVILKLIKGNQLIKVDRVSTIQTFLVMGKTHRIQTPTETLKGHVEQVTRHKSEFYHTNLGVYILCSENEVNSKHW